jgi:serine/threonine-protein kinase
VTGPALAQNAADKATAEALFNQGTKLLDEKNYAEACPKLAESLRLDPGVGVMLYLADCFEQSGKTASAWAQFRDAQDLAGKQGDAKRADIARGRANALEPKLPKLVITVAAEAKTAGLEVKRDDAVVGEAQWGAPLPVDPGAHAIAASAPNKKTWVTNVDVPADGGSPVTVAIPALEAGAEGGGGGAAGAVGGEGGGGGRSQRLIGLVVAGVGVVAVGVGAVFGLSAISQLNDSNSSGHCHPDNHCDPTGIQMRSDASSSATLSTIFVGAGAAALVGGAVLYFTAPSAKAATVTTQGKGLVLRVPF